MDLDDLQAVLTSKDKGNALCGFSIANQFQL
jgi:hypothetical protein